MFVGMYVFGMSIRKGKGCWVISWKIYVEKEIGILSGRERIWIWF